MTSAELLRNARRAAGLSQRGLAGRAQVSRRVVEDAERGEREPRADVLDSLLRACGFELHAREVVSPVDEVVRAGIAAHLALPLSHRVGSALGGPPGGANASCGSARWQELCRVVAVASRCALLPGPLAWSLWLPDVVLSGPPSVLVEIHRLEAINAVDGLGGVVGLELVGVPQPAWEGLIPLRLPTVVGSRRRTGQLFVPPPDRMVELAQPPWNSRLAAAASLLHECGPVDRAARRPPPHVQLDDELQARRTGERYDHSRRVGREVTPFDGRTGRLGVAASLDAEALRRGFVRWTPKPGWSRHGW